MLLGKHDVGIVVLLASRVQSNTTFSFSVDSRCKTELTVTVGHQIWAVKNLFNHIAVQQGPQRNPWASVLVEAYIFGDAGETGVLIPVGCFLK